MERQIRKLCPVCEKPFDVAFYPSKGYYVYKQVYCPRSCSAKRRTGEKAAHWKGGRAILRDKGRTYILLRIPGHPMATAQGYVREHRLMMAQKIGRLLNPNEVVHHKKSFENIDDNLELCVGKSGHMQHHASKGIKGFIDRQGNLSVKNIYLKMDEIEQALIKNRTRKEAAHQLGISLPTLYRKLLTLRQNS